MGFNLYAQILVYLWAQTKHYKNGLVAGEFN